MFKKIMVIALSCALSSTILAGCSSQPSPSSSEGSSNVTQSTTSSGEKIKVALLTSRGGLGDNGFNDLAWKGFQEAEKKFNIEIKVVENQTTAEYHNAIITVADNGYDFIMTVGGDWGDVLTEVAPKYPDIKFAGVNVDCDQPNVAVGIFGDHEGSFMAGALAAMMSETGTVGFLGADDTPNIRRFFVGFEEGVKYVNPEIKVLSTFVGSFTDPAKGKEHSHSLADQGCDIIFQAASITGLGLFEAVNEREGIYAIGVDQDQDDLAQGKVLTSMVKHFDDVALNNIESVVNGTFEGGRKVYSLDVDGVGLTEMKYTRELIGEEKLAKLEDIKAKIISDEIVVTDYYDQK